MSEPQDRPVPAVPEALDRPVPTPPTVVADEQVPAVTQALAALEGLDPLAVDDHVAVFEQVHSLLAGALAEPARD